MTKNLSIALVIVALVGCSGVSIGDTYALEGASKLYLDESDFRDARQLKEAGVARNGDAEWKLIAADRIVILGGGAQVKVVEHAKGGAKVAVTFGNDVGKLGWMLNEDMMRSHKP